MHTVSRAYFAQPPKPSHMPVCPQLGSPLVLADAARVGLAGVDRPAGAHAPRLVAARRSALAGDVAADAVGAEAGRTLGRCAAQRRAFHLLAAAAVHALLAADALAVGRARRRSRRPCRVARERRADVRRARPAAARRRRRRTRRRRRRRRTCPACTSCRPGTCGSRPRRRTCRRGRRSTTGVVTQALAARGVRPRRSAHARARASRRIAGLAPLRAGADAADAVDAEAAARTRDRTCRSRRSPSSPPGRGRCPPRRRGPPRRRPVPPTSIMAAVGSIGFSGTRALLQPIAPRRDDGEGQTPPAPTTPRPFLPTA